MHMKSASVVMAHMMELFPPEFYESHEFYWWEDASHKKYAEKIKQIREGILNLKNGFMLVRNIDNFHILYSFATKSFKQDFNISVLTNLNKFLEMGDYAYMEMRELYWNYCTHYEPPIIEKFYPFNGEKPLPRYTKKFITNMNNGHGEKLLENNPSIILMKNDQIEIPQQKSNIIYVDFKRRCLAMPAI
jgi:hypothetical protein